MITVEPMGRPGWTWFNHQLPILYSEDTSGLMAVSDDLNFVGGCVFDNWTETSVQCHLMVSTPMVIRRFLPICFDYVFNKKGKSIVYGLVPGDNGAAIKLNKHLGFTEKCRLEGAFKDGVDYVIMELRKESCKYLSEEEA